MSAATSSAARALDTTKVLTLTAPRVAPLAAGYRHDPGATQTWPNGWSPADASGTQSLRTVGVASVVYAVYVDDALVFVNPVDDAVRPDPRAVPAFELPSQRTPDPVRVGDQASEAELDDGAHDPR